MGYFGKMKGAAKSPPVVGLHEIVWPWIGSFTGIAAVGAVHSLIIGSQRIHELGYVYVFIPAGIGPIVMLVVALIVNNIPEKRRYPEFWF